MLKTEIRSGIVDMIESANNHWAICLNTGKMTFLVSDRALKTLCHLEINHELSPKSSSLKGFPHEVSMTVEQYDLLADKSEAYENVESH